MTTSRPPIEPYRIKVVEPIPFTDRATRAAALSRAGFNLFRLPADLVTIDLLTDSGVTAMSAAQWGRMFNGDESYAGSRSFARLAGVVTELTGFEQVIPTHQGRAAEKLLFSVLVSSGDIVPGNTHFDTTRANIEARGARAVDLCIEAARHPADPHPFKGDIDLGALERLLASSSARIPLVILTVTNNGAGGQPVSLANIAATRELCLRFDVPLYLDAARFAENAWFIREQSASASMYSPRVIAREMFDLADGCLMSAKKDGLVNIGGFLALRDDELAEELKRLMVIGEGFPTYGGLAGRDLEAMARGLEEVLEPGYLADRIDQVRRLGDRLQEAGVPTVRPTGGHAVYLDGRAFAPHVDPLAFPAQAVACALYLRAGIRTVEVGQLMAGRPDERGGETPVELDLVRMAIPRRVYTSRQLDYVADAVTELYRARDEIVGLELIDQPHALRHFGARLRPRAERRAEPGVSAPA